jgi:hypothetical protein
MKGKKIKEITPIEGIASTMMAIRDGIIGESPQDREDIFREEKDSWIVDTCCAFDTGTWETGISKDEGEKWIIVEQYKNREEAKKGHNKWAEKMTKNPNIKLKDIHVWGII